MLMESLRRDHGADRGVPAHSRRLLRDQRQLRVARHHSVRERVARDRAVGVHGHPAEMRDLASRVGEISLLSRTGGAPSLAVGMAQLFSNVLGGSTAMALWYHFAIMFEALFILTTIDAGTRVGRFMLQDLGGATSGVALGRLAWYPATVISSAVFVAMWGYFLYQGVNDPLGGINSLWPLVRNLESAARGRRAVRRHHRHHQDGARAICVGHDAAARRGSRSSRSRRGIRRSGRADPALGFLAHARAARDAAHGGALPPGVASAAAAARMAVNDRLDAGVAAFFIVCVIVVLLASMREWWLILSGRKVRITTEISVRDGCICGISALNVMFGGRAC